MTESGIKSFDNYKGKVFSETFGPLQKGFETGISVNTSDCEVAIYISKNNNPFVLKASGRTYCSYTIDF